MGLPMEATRRGQTETTLARSLAASSLELATN
jgi:hypothetical protein